MLTPNNAFGQIIGGKVLVCFEGLGEINVQSRPQQLIYYAADGYNQLTGKVVPKKAMTQFRLVSFSKRNSRLIVAIKNNGAKAAWDRKFFRSF